MKITQWIPTGSTVVQWPCIQSWIDLKMPEGCTRVFYKGAISSPAISWNKAVKDFLESDSEWLFSTHDDVVFEPETLTRLLSWDKPLVSALIFMRQSPVVPHIWKSYEDGQNYVHRIKDTRDWLYSHKEAIRFGAFLMTPPPEDSLTPVSFTSTSCVLIHRKVLEAMRAECGDKWFLMDDEINGGGEDRRFFEIAKRAGYEGFVDRSCVVGHLVGAIPTSTADFIAWDSVSQFNGTGEQ